MDENIEAAAATQSDEVLLNHSDLLCMLGEREVTIEGLRRHLRRQAEAHARRIANLRNAYDAELEQRDELHRRELAELQAKLTKARATARKKVARKPRSK